MSAPKETSREALLKQAADLGISFDNDPSDAELQNAIIAHPPKAAPRTRAKFRCSGKQNNTVFLHTVYSEEIQSENGRFTQATPWGEIKMAVDNPNASVIFEPGEEYYVDFTPAKPAS